MSNTQRIVDYTLKNAAKLSPGKIEALARMVGSLKGEVKKEPNAVPKSDEDNELLANRPVDMSDVTGVEIDGGPKRKVQIYAQEGLS